ncbi:molecular chaperone DnaJ [Synergistales bacterium]|nr:molecular chaperone DnaJ [Synergistales bacterium]
MDVSFEIARNLRTLGLPPGANASDVRAAFRALARTYHPDITGRGGARRFERITGAYTFLKNLPQDELLQIDMPRAADSPKPKREKEKSGGWFSRVGNPMAWRANRREKLKKEVSAREREKREAEEREARVKQELIDAALSRAEKKVEAVLERLTRETKELDAQSLVLRLSSDVSQVRHLALSVLGRSADSPEALRAIETMLKNHNIDEKTARLVALLPLSKENRKRLAESLADRAPIMPDFFLVWLLNMRETMFMDYATLERYIQKASPHGAASMLRIWPKGRFLSVRVLEELLSREDEGYLTPLLSAMKQRGVPCPISCRARLSALLEHPNSVVRVYARSLGETIYGGVK